MKPAIIGLVGTLVVAGCNTVSYSGPGLEPIPGSITYSGQPRTKLTKSPVGSAFRMISSTSTASRWKKPTSSNPTGA